MLFALTIAGVLMAGGILLPRLYIALLRDRAWALVGGTQLYRAEGWVRLRRGSGLAAQWTEGRFEVLVTERDAVLLSRDWPPIWLRRPGDARAGLVLDDPGARRDGHVLLEAPRADPPWHLQIEAPRPWKLIEALEQFLSHDPDAPPYR